MAPESALKQMENGEFEEVEVDEVDIGDILLVKRKQAQKAPRLMVSVLFYPVNWTCQGRSQHNRRIPSRFKGKGFLCIRRHNSRQWKEPFKGCCGSR